MSKSYNNTIPIFTEEKALLKMVRKIKTNSLEPGVPKDPDTCSVFKLYKAFASKSETEDLELRYRAGIGWGDAKNILFERLNADLRPLRENYKEIIDDRAKLETTLKEGAIKARGIASKLIEDVRHAVGIKSFVN